MSNGSVFVVGSLHYDIVLNAPHLPASDETVMGSNVQFVCGGKGGNQAVAASRHGADVKFAGAVGQDFFAEALMEHLTSAKVDISQVARVNTSASGMSVAIVDTAGDYGAVVASGANQMIKTDRILVPSNTALLVLQNEIPESVNITIATKVRDAGGKIILNAAPMRSISSELLSMIDVLIVNRVEAESLFEKPCQSIGDAHSLLEGTPRLCETVIVTLGGHGLVYATANNTPRQVNAFEVDTISSHGAGDCFVGAFLARFENGDKLEQALEYASAAAALHVSTPVEQRGTINRDAVRKLMA